MGQYKLETIWKIQFGFLMTFNPGFELIVDIPFIRIYFGLTGGAHGFNIFGWEEF